MQQLTEPSKLPIKSIKKKTQMVIITIFIFQNEERKVKRVRGCLRWCFEEQGWKSRSPDFLYQKSLLTTLPSLWICTLVCAEDQIRINLYPQGTVIAELITKGHICTPQHVNWCYLFEWRFPPCFFSSAIVIERYCCGRLWVLLKLINAYSSKQNYKQN